MPHPAIAVFTEKDRATILAQGGSQAWVLNPNQALKHRYLVLTRNQVRRNPAASEPHKSAFLVGLIEDVVPVPVGEGPQRYLIRLSEAAEVNLPQIWKDWRNPVRYTTLEKLGIDPASLSFRPLSSGPAPAAGGTAAAGLTIAQAKEGLARTFGVSPEAIEIIIRG